VFLDKGLKNGNSTNRHTSICNTSDCSIVWFNICLIKERGREMKIYSDKISNVKEVREFIREHKIELVKEILNYQISSEHFGETLQELLDKCSFNIFCEDKKAKVVELATRSILIDVVTSV